MDRKHEVREALQKVNPALAGKVQFATGQMSFGFPAGEEPKDHDWRFVGIDLEAGAVSRFQCQRCGHWMSRRETKVGAKVLYYSVEFPNQWKPLERRPLCKREGDDDA